MKVFLAGATGVVGRSLTPMLVAAGHEVVGTTRNPAQVPLLRRLGATPVVLDGLDARAVLERVSDAAPDAVIHQMTSLKTMGDLKNLDADFATTNRLRIEGTDVLLEAARKVGARRFVAQSFTGWTNPRTGGRVKTEDDGLDPRPVTSARETLAAIAHVERVVPQAADLTGIVLRFGLLYGPGTSLGRGGGLLAMVSARRFPLVGKATGVWSFVHVEDAARATVQALDHGSSGVYNVVDDEPSSVSQWLPALADAVSAPPPRHVPAWLARPLIGEQGVAMMTQSRGSSNERAKRELDWQPRYPTWRDGFRSGLG
jgi:nucleoside-diphosphate-sugar epimerase